MTDLEKEMWWVVSLDILDDYYPMTTGFEEIRKKRDGSMAPHGGYDFGATQGTKIYVPSVVGAEGLSIDFVWERKDPNDSAGWFVILKGVDELGQKVEWQFNHMSEYNPFITSKAGDKRIRQATPGMILGLVGNTGKSSASHLDVKLKVNGKHYPIVQYYKDIEIAREKTTKEVLDE